MTNQTRTDVPKCSLPVSLDQIVLYDFLQKMDTETTHYILSADYDGSLAPKQTRDDGTKVDEPLPIHISVDIMNFDKIDTVKMMFSVMMRVNITWKERRLKFLNLRDDIYENMISRKIRNDIWIPEIGKERNQIQNANPKLGITFSGFFNAITGTVRKDPFTAFMIRRDSEADLPDFTRPREDYVFDGYGNSLILLRR